MSAPWKLILLVLALVLFFIGGVLWPPPSDAYRLRIVSAGLFFYILSLLVS
jgi:hypothetical protein